MPSSHRRTSALVILGLILLSPLPSAGELRGHAMELRADFTAPEISLSEQIWEIVARLWGKDGGSADPKEESQPAATGSLIKCENGGSIDPDGHCRP